MKNIQETLQMKEQEMKRLEKEISVLRAALSILNDTEASEDFSAPVRTTPAAASVSYPPVNRAPERAVSEPVPAASPYPTFARNADMIEQIRPEGMADRPKRSFP
jgi:hypothetical protein